MDRRNFLRTGSLAALGSLAAPSLKPCLHPYGRHWEEQMTNLPLLRNESFRRDRSRFKESVCCRSGKRRRLCRSLLEHTLQQQRKPDGRQGKQLRSQHRLRHGRACIGRETKPAMPMWKASRWTKCCVPPAIAARIASSGKAGKTGGTDGEDNSQKPLCRRRTLKTWA